MNEGQKIYNIAEALFPICRSITGEGVRQSLAIINSLLKNSASLELNIYNVPSGTRVFDWIVPKEWEINEAYIADEAGNIIIDYKMNNLHVVSYSAPIDKWVDLAELSRFVFTQKDQPDAIPYVTSYYNELSGFCMSQNQFNSLPKGKYHMLIDSKLFNGNLTYADLVLPGKSDKEIFISTYICHPSMANNECSGPALITELIKYVNNIKDRRYTYRFVIAPETIGALTYLSEKNRLQYMKKNVIAAFNLSCVGDDRAYSMVRSRNGNTLADRVMSNVLSSRNNVKEYSFLKRASDERQYCAPGVDLPMVSFCRSKYQEYPEYHTSLDNMGIISPSGFQGSYDVMQEVIDIIEVNDKYRCMSLGEPQLGRRKLYPNTGQKGAYAFARIFQDILAYSDGEKDIVDISNIIGIPINKIMPAIYVLIKNNLLISSGRNEKCIVKNEIFEQDECLKDVEECPWCLSTQYDILFSCNSFDVCKCKKCEFVFSSKILNQIGLKKYWLEYESHVHMKDELMSLKRKEMYKIEYDFIHEFLNQGDSILDVGCSNGDFLNLFSNEGFCCEGVEFGEEAYRETSLKFKCYLGDIQSVPEDNRYDCVIFRGVIQYLINPKKDIKKAVQLLNDGGIIYITSSPNADSICFNLYKDKFVLPVDPVNYYMYTEKMLTRYFYEMGIKLVKQGWLYKGTPYENYSEDVKSIVNALKEAKSGRIVSKCPPFFDNMLTLVYKKAL